MSWFIKCSRPPPNKLFKKFLNDYDLRGSFARYKSVTLGESKKGK